MEHKYHTLIKQIHAPAGLNDRVLSAAAEQTGVKNQGQSRKRPVWRAAVCAALALALVLGGVSLQPVKTGMDAERIRQDEGVESLGLTCEFGLTSYAADVLPAANGNLVLGSGNGDGIQIQTTELQPERAQFTNYLFQIRGENIESLIMTMDRGGLYRARSGQSLLSVLSNPAEEVYDPEAVYGLWVPPREWLEGRGTSMLDGAQLTVTARFMDGVERTAVYHLSIQQLQISENEDGTELLIPALEGSDPADASGLYLESLNSTWFQWPVEGSNTVSLSNRYGYRTAPGGETGTFHAGIDIPAEQGTAVTAAASGVVTKAEFAPDKGNYLVLDHGNGMETVYAHCLRLAVKEGDLVSAGQEIAAVGSTGKSTGPHLHFEVRQDGEAQNPVAYFDRGIRDTLKMG